MILGGVPRLFQRQWLTAASNVVSSGFTANWSPIAIATGYRLDVSLSNTFSSYLTGYQNRDVGNVTNFSISGLSTGTTYYYRVRAYGPPGHKRKLEYNQHRHRAGSIAGLCDTWLAQYSFPSSALVMSPTQPYMYATVPSQNCVAIINANTLAVESTPVRRFRPVESRLLARWLEGIHHK